MQKPLLKKGIAVAVIVLFIGMSVIPSTSTIVEQSTVATSNGKTLYVGGSGPGNYTTIQDAIDNASDGDTVYVYDDSSPYYEYLKIDKSINLVGEDRVTTVIDGSGSGRVLSIIADWVNVSGFRIIKAYMTIVIDSERNNISNNILEAHPAHGYGILCYSGYNIISNNYIFDSTNGTSIYGGENNVITHNWYVDNDNVGIVVYGGGNNTICFNTFVDNTFGIILVSSNNDVFNCNINSSNYDGIYLEGSYNTIKNCNIISCNRYGIYLFPSSSNNMIYHNNLINNTQNARDEGSNTWDDGYPSGGNYWSDYTGEDNNGDGIGDTPYPVPGGSNEDRFPLMEPWGGENQPPDAPIITGPINGKICVLYDYNFSLFDPDGDSMDLRVDWGVGGPGKLYGPFDSGTIVTLNYSWCKKGNYTIRAQAKDEYGAIGEWGLLEVTMPKNKPFIFNFPLLNWLFERFPNVFLILRLLLGLT